jgi:hypothetical protein
MPEKASKRAAQGVLVSCTTCMAEIPRSEAYSPEGADYTLYFCGLKCFDAWRLKSDRGGGESSGKSQ